MLLLLETPLLPTRQFVVVVMRRRSHLLLVVLVSPPHPKRNWDGIFLQ
jgi:hypothetical protein